MKKKFADYVPVGFNAEAEKNWLIAGFVLSFLLAMNFPIAYKNAYDGLFQETSSGSRYLLENAVMKDFYQLLGVSFYGFFILALAMTALAAYHYSYHFQGSKSIYLMKRLSDKRQLARRCFAVPLAAGAAALAAAFLLLVIYYRIYLSVTPEQCLTPNQWQKLWNM